MDTDRKLELSSSLERHLAGAITEGRLDDRARVLWLSDQLREYIDRLDGFCALDTGSSDSLLSGNLFAAVEVAVEALRERVGEASPFLHARSCVDALVDSLETARRRLDTSSIATMRAANDELRASMALANR